MMYVIGPGHGGPGLVASRLAGGHLQRGLPGHRRTTRRGCAGCSRSSRSPAASRATSPPRRPGRSTRAASSATRCRTPTAPRSTTRTSWWPRSSGTARPRPVRWRRAGTRTSSSTLAGTAPCCRSCTSTATRSPTRRCSPASPRTSCSSLLRGYGHTPYVVAGRRPGLDAPGVRRDAGPLPRRDPGHPATRPAPRGRQPVARRPWPMIVLRSPKGWTGPKEVDGQTRRGLLAVPPGARSPTPAATTRTARCSRSGCAATGPRSSSTTTGAPVRRIADLHPGGERRMSANPHANGGLLLRDLRMPDFREYAVDVDAPGTGAVEATRVLGRFLRDVMAAQPATGSGCSPRTRTTPTGCRTSWRSPTAPGTPRPARTTTTSPSTAGSWRSCPSTPARAGSRATC